MHAARSQSNPHARRRQLLWTSDCGRTAGGLAASNLLAMEETRTMRLFVCSQNASAIGLRRKIGPLMLALTLSGFAWADAREDGCRHSNNRAAGCSSIRERSFVPVSERRTVPDRAIVPGRTPVRVPEPGAVGELVLGLAGVGLGFVALRQRKSIQLK